MLGEMEIAVKAGEIDGHIGSNAEAYEDQHGRYEYGFRIKEGKSILCYYDHDSSGTHSSRGEQVTLSPMSLVHQKLMQIIV